jgi:hypothetical protein
VRLGQGRQAAHRHLRAHPELAGQLDRELRARLSTTTEPPALEPAAS